MFRFVTRTRFDGGTRPALRLFSLLIPVVVLISFPALAESPPLVDESFSERQLQAMKQSRAVIHTRFGKIQLRFFPEEAPNHVNNFLELARKDFYNGTTFHRVIPGFMVQGGDPLTREADRSRHGTGGPDYRLKAEFSHRPHNRRTLSMARSAHPDSAGSQFFICVADAPHLDGQYTVFGEVVEGMAVVDKIAAEPRDRRDNPKERVEMRVEVIPPENAGEPAEADPAPADSSDAE
ncbi:MAG: peptidylprolyl isomerase [Desulfococcaceae bacterium]